MMIFSSTNEFVDCLEDAMHGVYEHNVDVLAVALVAAGNILFLRTLIPLSGTNNGAKKDRKSSNDPKGNAQINCQLSILCSGLVIL